MKYPHWQYFIALENSFKETVRYVELSEKNYSTFSVEYAGLLLSTASEVDVVCKLLCNRIAPAAKADDMDKYRQAMLATYPRFSTIKILVPPMEADIEPWKAWGAGTNPDWWRMHNKVKHDRGSYFEEANLKNA